MRLYQINDDDLKELEYMLPQWAEQLDFVQAKLPESGPRLRRQIEIVKRIIADVRWNYHPHSGVEIVPDDTETSGEAE